MPSAMAQPLCAFYFVHVACLSSCTAGRKYHYGVHASQLRHSERLNIACIASLPYLAVLVVYL